MYDALSADTKGGEMTLAGKWGIFKRQVMPKEAPQQQVLFGQGCYLAGAQAAFQILSATSEMTPERSLVAWHELQAEIMNAVGRPQESLVDLPPERQVIV